MTTETMQLERTYRTLQRAIASGECLGAQVSIRSDKTDPTTLVVARPGRLRHRGEDALGPDTKLRWLCAGKPLLACACVMLDRSGLLRCDVPIAEYLKVSDEIGELTIADLLAQRVGFRDDPPAELLAVRSETECLRIALASEPATGFRALFPYNLWRGWWLVAGAIEAVSGELAADVIEQSVLRPFGMADTSIGFTGRGRVPVAGGFGNEQFRFGPIRWSRRSESLRVRCPAMNIWGPASDLSRFYSSIAHSYLDEAGHSSECDDAATLLAAMTRSSPLPPLGVSMVAQRLGLSEQEALIGHTGRGAAVGWRDTRRSLSVGVAYVDIPESRLSQARDVQIARDIYGDLGQ